MNSERNHHKSKDDSYEIVVIPAGEAANTKSAKISRTVIIGGITGIVLAIAALTSALLFFTPISRYLPVSDGQISARYGNQLLDVQERLTNLSQEVLVLREYNRKLRFALGQGEAKDSIAAELLQPNVESGKVAAITHSDEPGNEKVESEIRENISQRKILSQVLFEKEKSFQPQFPLIAPVSGVVSRIFFAEQGHFGVDFAGKIGALIVAPADGFVVFSGWTPDDGFVLMISHGGGYLTQYKHNQNVLKSAGDFVRRGETIALLGNTGKTSYGPHLHFEVWKDGQPRNPSDYFIASAM